MKNLEMKVYVTNLGKYNEGYLVGEWLNLPTDEEEIKNTLANIGINENYEEWFITDYENNLELKISEYVDLFKLNKKIEEIEKMDVETDVLKAYLEMTGDDILESDIWELENKINDLMVLELEECSTLSDEEKLGYAYIESLYGSVKELPKEEKERHFDIESYKKDLELEGILSDEEIESVIDEIEYCGIEEMVSEKTLENYFDYEAFGRDLSFDFYISNNEIAISNY